jgi:hypothetical protein
VQSGSSVAAFRWRDLPEYAMIEKEISPTPPTCQPWMPFQGTIYLSCLHHAVAPAPRSGVSPSGMLREAIPFGIRRVRSSAFS